jgi:hypothetical protein
MVPGYLVVLGAETSEGVKKILRKAGVTVLSPPEPPPEVKAAILKKQKRLSFRERQRRLPKYLR